MLSTFDLVHASVSSEKIKEKAARFLAEKPGYAPIFLSFDTSPEIHRYLISKESHLKHLLVAFMRKYDVGATYGMITMVEREGARVKSFQVSPSLRIQDIYDKYAHQDGFIYLKIVRENVFG
jgi:hypothetical protein